MKFEAWRDYDVPGEGRENARTIEAYDEESAARIMCELKFSDWDYPSCIDDLCVAVPGSEVIWRFDVEIETVPNFIPRKQRPSVTKPPDTTPLRPNQSPSGTTKERP